MEYNIIFQRVFNDILFIGYYRLEDIPYSGVICTIISYFFLRSAYSPRRVTCLPLHDRALPQRGRRGFIIIYLSVHLSIYLSIYIYMCVYRSIYLSTYIYIYIYICLSIYLYMCIYLSIYNHGQAT